MQKKMYKLNCKYFKNIFMNESIKILKIITKEQKVYKYTPF